MGGQISECPRCIRVGCPWPVVKQCWLPPSTWVVHWSSCHPPGHPPSPKLSTTLLQQAATTLMHSITKKQKQHNQAAMFKNKALQWYTLGNVHSCGHCGGIHVAKLFTSGFDSLAPGISSVRNTSLAALLIFKNSLYLWNRSLI